MVKGKKSVVLRGYLQTSGPNAGPGGFLRATDSAAIVAAASSAASMVATRAAAAISMRIAAAASAPTTPFIPLLMYGPGMSVSGTSQSITCMPVYANMSFEELRFIDYSRGNTGITRTVGSSTAIAADVPAVTPAASQADVSAALDAAMFAAAPTFASAAATVAGHATVPATAPGAPPAAAPAAPLLTAPAAAPDPGTPSPSGAVVQPVLLICCAATELPVPSSHRVNTFGPATETAGYFQHAFYCSKYNLAIDEAAACDNGVFPCPHCRKVFATVGSTSAFLNHTRTHPVCKHHISDPVALARSLQLRAATNSASYLYNTTT